MWCLLQRLTQWTFLARYWTVWKDFLPSCYRRRRWILLRATYWTSKFNVMVFKPHEINIEDSAIVGIACYYTREAGVRNLEREISRSVLKQLRTSYQTAAFKSVTVNIDNPRVLGCSTSAISCGWEQPHRSRTALADSSWRRSGWPSKLNHRQVKVSLTQTGSLGDVMKESIQRVRLWSCLFVRKIWVHPDFYEKRDIHVHVPKEHRKDGPSAYRNVYGTCF